jgi:hypothetical protein
METAEAPKSEVPYSAPAETGEAPKNQSKLGPTESPGSGAPYSPPMEIGKKRQRRIAPPMSKADADGSGKRKHRGRMPMGIVEAPKNQSKLGPAESPGSGAPHSPPAEAGKETSKADVDGNWKENVEGGRRPNVKGEYRWKLWRRRRIDPNSARWNR